MKNIEKTFKLTMGGSAVIDLKVEGSKDLVNAFCNQALTDTFGAFYKTREVFQEYVVNGIKLKAQFIWRDEKGHFLSQEKIVEIMNKT